MMSRMPIGISWRDGFHAVRLAAPEARSAWKRTLQISCREGFTRSIGRSLLMLAAAALFASSGSVFAAGTGTLDRLSGWYEAGSNITVTATPALYSQFDYWTGDTNGASIAGSQISFVVSASKSITAAFKTAVTVTNAVPHEWLANQNPAWTNDFEASVTNDADGDGFTTAQEYWSGTDPQSGSSYLKIDEVSYGGTDITIEWQHSRVDAAIPPIAIQACSNLVSGAWATVFEKSPVDGVNYWTNSASQSLFYRLAVTNLP